MSYNNAKSALFNTEMVKAILDGRKVQFRRVIKDNDLIDTLLKNGGEKTYKAFVRFDKYKVDDILWVKEPTKVIEFRAGKIEYKHLADNERNIIGFPSRLYIERTKGYKIDYPMWLINCQDVPNGCIKEMARIFLKVTNVRVERLQDMSIKDVIKEGCPKKLYDGTTGTKREVVNWWINLWNSTSKQGYKWEDNPYVFVYDFEALEIK